MKLGQPVQMHENGKKVIGHIVGIDPNGCEIEWDDGTYQSIGWGMHHKYAFEQMKIELHPC